MIQSINISPNKKTVATLHKMMEQKEEYRKKIIAKAKALKK